MEYSFKAPAGTARVAPDITIQASEGALTLKGEGLCVTLCDAVHNGAVGSGRHSSMAIILPVQEGDYPLFTEKSAVTAVDEDENRAVWRVSTPLGLNGAAAVPDLWLWRKTRLVTLATYFETDAATPVRALRVCDVKEAAEGVSVFTGGAWKPAAGACGVVWSGQTSDLRDFCEAAPFVTHIAYGGETPDLPALECPKAAAGALCELVSGDLTVTLSQGEDGVSLYRVADAKSGDLLAASASAPLFRVTLRLLGSEHEYTLDSLSGWTKIRRETDDDTTEWVFSHHENGLFKGVSMRVTAVCDAPLSRIAWSLDVTVRSDSLSVTRADPPVLKADAAEDTRLFMALDSGVSLPFGPGREVLMQFDYPQITLCMQYMALWRPSTGRGVYAGLHDPMGDLKVITASQHDGVCALEATIPARGMGEAANGFRLDGELVWQVFDGDWYDATVIYRDFVYTRATWFTGELAKDRRDVPEWMLKAPLWFNVSCIEKDWLEKLFEATDDIGVPTAVHMYNWHEIPFDTNYPHYKPAREDFARKLPVMKAHGIRVMPYINGRLWDTHDRGDYDFQFTSIAKPNATKGWRHDYVDETYLSKNSRGESVRLGVMCPSTAVWQEKVTELVSWIVNDLGADSVYIDQIGAAQPVACMDRSHPHRPGGGSWWYEHYYNLLDHVREQIPAEAGLTTEANGEVYTGHIGSFLVWHWSGLEGWSWNGESNVPAFQVIYAPYQPTFGRCHNFKPTDDVSFRLMTAQSLCYGNQLGWLSASFYQKSPSKAFFKQAAQLRDAYGEYFYAGVCLRPPRLTGDVRTLTDGFMTTPSVIGALWKRLRDGKTLLVLSNLADEPAVVTAEGEGVSVTRTLPAATTVVEEL